MDSDGIACISEYGLEITLRGEASTKPIQTNVRCTAPEVLDTDSRWILSVGSGKAADIYSLAMVMFEVSLPYLRPQTRSTSLTSSQILSGTTPFPKESGDEIVKKVAIGLRPEWPSNHHSRGLVDVLREPIESCWNQEPGGRPSALEVLQTLLALEGKDHLEESTSRVDRCGLRFAPDPAPDRQHFIPRPKTIKSPETN